MAIDRGGVGVQAEPSVTPPPTLTILLAPEENRARERRAGALATFQVCFPGGRAHRPAGRVPGLAGTGRESQGTPLSLSAVLRASSALDLQCPGPPWATRTAGEDQGIVWFDLLVHVINSVIYMFE